MKYIIILLVLLSVIFCSQTLGQSTQSDLNAKSATLEKDVSSIVLPENKRTASVNFRTGNYISQDSMYTLQGNTLKLFKLRLYYLLQTYIEECSQDSILIYAKGDRLPNTVHVRESNGQKIYWNTLEMRYADKDIYVPKEPTFIGFYQWLKSSFSKNP